MRRLFISVCLLIMSIYAPAAAADLTPVHGKASDTCAPWDGAALAITLERDHISATIYASRNAINDRLNATHRFAAFPATKFEEGAAGIFQCDVNGANCRNLDGEVKIETIGPDYIVGEIYAAQSGTRYHFKVDYRVPAKPAFCG